MARRLRTSIAVTQDVLKPPLYDPKEVLSKLKERQRKQKLQHDKTAGGLPPLRDGEVVSVREGNKWKSARSTRVSQVLPSSRPCKVETARGGGYRRNRRHLLRTEESQIPEITPTPEVSNDEDLTDTNWSHPLLQWPTRILEHRQLECLFLLATRSGRTTRKPPRFKDYMLSISKRGSSSSFSLGIRYKADFF